MRRNDRGQLVLLAAVVIAVALVPMLTALWQLGYAGDVRSTPVDRAASAETVDVLERAVADAANGVPARHDWGERTTAAASIRSDLEEAIAAIRDAHLASTAVVSVSENATAARRFAAGSCPGGPGRDFGPCEADGGLVLQSREGQTHLVAILVEVTVTGPDEDSRTTAAVRRVPGE